VSLRLDVRLEIASNSSELRIGLGTYASIPAARHLSRSPLMACAVMAIIGIRLPVNLSLARILLVASKPSIFRHLDVHQHQIEGFALHRQQRLTTVADDHGRVSLFLQQLQGISLINDIVISHQDM
jgi:hypothetical protein